MQKSTFHFDNASCSPFVHDQEDYGLLSPMLGSAFTRPLFPTLALNTNLSDHVSSEHISNHISDPYWILDSAARAEFSDGFDPTLYSPDPPPLIAVSPEQLHTSPLEPLDSLPNDNLPDENLPDEHVREATPLPDVTTTRYPQGSPATQGTPGHARIASTSSTSTRQSLQSSGTSGYADMSEDEDMSDPSSDFEAEPKRHHKQAKRKRRSTRKAKAASSTVQNAAASRRRVIISTRDGERAKPKTRRANGPHPMAPPMERSIRISKTTVEDPEHPGRQVCNWAYHCDYSYDGEPAHCSYQSERQSDCERHVLFSHLKPWDFACVQCATYETIPYTTKSGTNLLDTVGNGRKVFRRLHGDAFSRIDCLKRHWNVHHRGVKWQGKEHALRCVIRDWEELEEWQLLN